MSSNTIVTASNLVQVSQSPSSAPSSSSSGVGAAPIVGGVLGGIVLLIVTVIMIVPCARRRQKHLRDPGSGDGPRVLRKATDVDASEPMMNGSWRDRTRMQEDDQMRLVEAGAAVTMEPGLIKGLPLWNYPSPQVLQPVAEGLIMEDSDKSHHNPHASATYFPQPVPSTSVGRHNSRSMIPRFPSLDRLWPLTTAFRTSLTSSPSTRTKSSAGSVPSKSSRKHSWRARSGHAKQGPDPDALVSPTLLGQHVGLGRGRASMDVEIKQANPASGVRYETAPIHQAFTLQKSVKKPPRDSHRGQPSGSSQPQPHHSKAEHVRRQPSDNSEHRHHRRQRSTDHTLHPETHKHQKSSIGHSRQNAAEPSTTRTQHPTSHSQSRTDIPTLRKSGDKRVRPSTSKGYDFYGHPT